MGFRQDMVCSTERKTAMRRKAMTLGTIACVAALVVASLALAQPGRRGDRGGPQDERGARRFDPERMRQMMADRMKQQLGASDAEWQVIQPRLVKVMTLNRQVSGGPGRAGLFFGRGRSFPGEAVRIESTELICQLVAEKAGASILPRLSVAMSACSDRVAVAELDVEPISFDWHLLHGGETAPGLLDCIEQDSYGWLETAS